MNIFSQAVQAGKVGELEIQPSYIEVSKYKYGSIAAINSNDNLWCSGVDTGEKRHSVKMPCAINRLEAFDRCDTLH